MLNMASILFLFVWILFRCSFCQNILTFNYIYFEIWNKIKALINNDESFFQKHVFLHFNCTHEANTINIHMNYYHTMEFIIRYVYKAYALIILLIMKIAFIKKSCFVLWKYIIGRQNFLWKLKEVLYRVTCSVLKGEGYVKEDNKSSRQKSSKENKDVKNVY